MFSGFFNQFNNANKAVPSRIFLKNLFIPSRKLPPKDFFSFFSSGLSFSSFLDSNCSSLFSFFNRFILTLFFSFVFLSDLVLVFKDLPIPLIVLSIDESPPLIDDKELSSSKLCKLGAKSLSLIFIILFIEVIFLSLLRTLLVKESLFIFDPFITVVFSLAPSSLRSDNIFSAANFFT